MESLAGLNEPAEPPRPRAVTAIGRIWLVAGIFLFLVAAVDLIFWVVLRPAMPTILDYASRREPGMRFLSPYFRYYATIKSLEALFSAAVVFSAYSFLKLRGWARGALEAASWLYLAYITVFASLSFAVWRRASLDPATVAAHPNAGQRLVGGLAIGILLVAGLVWMIVLLRGRKVRAAFAAGPR